MHRNALISIEAEDPGVMTAQTSVCTSTNMSRLRRSAAAQEARLRIAKERKETMQRGELMGGYESVR